jgi:bifunctional oligoribonuclease and PAP phosphatase NrnA
VSDAMEPSSASTEPPDRSATIDWARFVELIRSHQRFLLTTHIRPDCDAVGSTMAMSDVLQGLGKEVILVTGFDTPANLRFLDPQQRIRRVGKDAPPEIADTVDLLMVLDTSAWAQLGEMAGVLRATRAKKVVLDHHLSSDDLGAEVFRDTQAEATGRLVVDAADRLGVPLATETAVALFAALATDTGWFRFASTTAETYRLAARLSEAGVRPDKLYQQLYERDTFARLQLIGRALARTASEMDGRLIYTSLLRKDFEETGAEPSDSEDVINLTLTVDGTEVAVILVEQIGGGFKISFRSRNKLDCSALAEQFGGGGHKAAAGAFLREPLEVAQARVLDAVRAAMR